MTFFEFSDYLTNVTPFVVLIGVVVALFFLDRLNLLKKAVLLYLSLMFLFDVVSYLLGYVFKTNNQIILPIYSLTEITFFLWFYNKYLFERKHRVINVLGVFGVIYIAFELLTDFIINHISPEQFQPYAKVVDNFVIILLALTFLYEKMSTYTESRWDNFRLNIVLLVFFTLNTIIFLPFNFLVNEDSGIKFYFWAGNVILLLLFYSYLIFEIIKIPKLKT